MNTTLNTETVNPTAIMAGLLPDEFDPELDGEELDLGTEVETEFVQVEEDFR